MKTKLAALLIAATALAGCNASGVSRNVPDDAQFSNGGRTGVSERVSAGNALSLASIERRQQGLSGLRGNAQLQRAAQAHADWMARNGLMSHTGAGGSRFSDRIRSTGYNLCYGAENVAYGQRSAEHVMYSWMTSPGHRKNMLNPNVVDAAVASAVDGVGQVYWAMLLAKPC